MSTAAFRQGCCDFRGFLAVAPSEYLFRVFSEARPALLEFVLNDAHCEVRESLCELGPERLERRDQEGKCTD
jgi:hypothetical protein